MLRFNTTVVGLLLLLIPLSLQAQVALNQTDNFQDGTLNGWTSGAQNPTPPQNIASDGPAGASDKYMQVTSNGGSGAGSKLVIMNTTQWKGDYTSAGVTSISIHVKNEGSTALQLRVALIGASGDGVSTSAVNLSVGSGWTSVVFPVTADALTGTNVASALTSVTELRLLHSASASTKGDAIAAQLGVDDITALSATNGVIVESSGIPREFALHQNYPNPFNPTTTIEFTVPVEERTSLKVFDELGHEVAILFEGNAAAGVVHKVQFDGTGLASAVYFVRMEAGASTQMKKMLLLK